MDKDDVKAAFVAAGLSRVLKDLDYLTKPSIRLYTTPAGENDISIGQSRIGGVPDVQPGFAWPDWKGVPQSFVAQISLDEIHPYDTNGALPSRRLARRRLAAERAGAETAPGQPA